MLLACLALASCSRRGEPRFQKIAIVPFENLSADAGRDWMSRGFAEALRLALTGVPDADPVAVPALRDAPSVGASRILEGYFAVDGDRLEVRAVLEDARANRAVKVASAGGALAAGVLPLSASLARELDARARPAATNSGAALRAYLQALEATEPNGAPAGFERAVTADPSFGAAWLAWGQWLTGRGERPRAREVIAAARAHSARFPAVERARLDLLGASLNNDRGGQRRALIALTRLTSADTDIHRALGDLEFAGRAYASAIHWYGQALARDPDNALLLNQLGYAHAFARDLDGAAKALTRYRDLRPREANPSDSLGDAHFYLGRFADAEKYYLEAYGKDPSFQGASDLYKAAWARLMRGDVKAADEAFSKFNRADRSWPYQQAQWEFLTGRRKQALARLEEFARSGPPAAAPLAFARLSIWNLELGDAGRAREYAQRIVGGGLGALCRFLTQPSAPPSEWAARAERVFSDPAQAGLKEYALAYALLLSKEFAAATAPLQRLHDRTAPTSPEPVDVLWAWALVESGRLQEAGPLLGTNPIPDASGEHPFLSLSFPRLFYLRGRLAQSQGRMEEARADYRLFLTLSGDLPMKFGEEQRARAAAGGS